MDKTVWYKKIGSDEELINSAIIHARVTGSIGASEIYEDGFGNVARFAEVRREGYQDKDYVLI